MSEQDSLMERRKQETLAAERWRCRLCDMAIEGSGSVDEDEKESFLKAHLHDLHLHDTNFNRDMKEEFMVLYFIPIIETIRPNQRFQ